MPDDKFISPCPPPTPRQREILTVLIEECAEVQQRATKALRFGMGEIQPGQSYTNSTRLATEVGDLSAVLDMAVREHVIPHREIARSRTLKERKLAKYMQTEPLADSSRRDADRDRHSGWDRCTNCQNGHVRLYFRLTCWPAGRSSPPKGL